MSAGGDIVQSQGQGAKFPTRTFEGYDANDGAAWGIREKAGDGRSALQAFVYSEPAGSLGGERWAAGAAKGSKIARRQLSN
jgi:hypothetical protein